MKQGLEASMMQGLVFWLKYLTILEFRLIYLKSMFTSDFSENTSSVPVYFILLQVKKVWQCSKTICSYIQDWIRWKQNLMQCYFIYINLDCLNRLNSRNIHANENTCQQVGASLDECPTRVSVLRHFRYPCNSSSDLKMFSCCRIYFAPMWEAPQKRYVTFRLRSERSHRMLKLHMLFNILQLSV